MSKEVLICGFDNTLSIARRVANSLNSAFSPIIVSSFPDGEKLVRIKENPKGKKVVIISSMHPSPDERIIETILAGSIARDNGAKEVILFATYLPYLRQDKSFNDYEAVSAKHIMSLFASKFDRIIVVDPHLHRIDSLKEYSSKAGEVSSDEAIINYLKKMKGDFVIVGPDEESSEWDKDIAKKLGKEYHILIKNRSSAEKVRVSGETFSLKGKNTVIIDDIISTGHTLAESLKLIKSRGARKITCIGIHGLLVNGANKLITKYADLVTTNTIHSKYSKIDVSPLIAETLKKII